jgi:hypothetical protein
MAEHKEKQAQTVHQDGKPMLEDAADEKEIELRHQYQMFPTPDETFAAETITELKD